MPSSITVTSDSTLNITLYGAGGGTGGSDAGHRGAIGSPGDRVSVSINAAPGQTYYVSTGTAGANGASNVRGTGGGAGGTSLDGFSGGTGGNAGPVGFSGGGAGGGGATVLFTYEGGIKKYLAVAAGGAGGGGAGNFSNGVDFSYGLAQSYYPKYYAAQYNRSWSSVLQQYGVNNGGGTYTLSYGFYVDTYKTYVLYGSADDEAYIYVNGVYIGSSASWRTISTHNINLRPGFNRLDITVVNSGGGPTAYGAYVKDPATNTIIGTTRDAYNTEDFIYNAGRGGQGQSNLGDGGGGGGGGGGYKGGAGGEAASGDYGANSGYAGSSLALTSNYLTPNSIRDQWSTVDNASIARFAGSSRNSNGYFEVSSLSSDINIKESNRFRSVTGLQYRSNGSWVAVGEAYVRHNNQWVSLIKQNSFITSYSGIAAENNITGYMVPYTPPVVTYDYA